MADNDEIDAPGVAGTLQTDDEKPTAEAALCAAVLDTLIPRELARSLLAALPIVVVIAVPTPAWARGICRALRTAYPRVSATSVCEARRANRYIDEDTLLTQVKRGGTMIVVSQDPTGVVPDVIRHAADYALTFTGPAASDVRRAVSAVAGKRVRDLASNDIAGLDFDDLCAAIRPGSEAKDCVLRLRRAASGKTLSHAVPNVPSLDELPLTPEVRAWSHETLGAMKRLEVSRDTGASPFTLLYGPPGTGKTLVAASLARSANWPLVSTSVGSWFAGSDGYLGGVTKAARTFFDTLLSQDRVVGLIDEMDAIPNRATLDSKNRDFWTPVVTDILVQIDRLRHSGRPVVLIGASNFGERTDEALVRPGRLGRKVHMRSLRTPEEFAALFRFYLSGRIADEEIAPLVELGMALTSITPAVVSNWVRSATVVAEMAGRELRAADLAAQILPPETRSEDELRQIAIHESGHAIVAGVLGLKVSRVSIIADGTAAGVTTIVPNGALANKDRVEATVTMMLGGRAADEVVGSGATAGAHSDLMQATATLADAHLAHGLYGRLFATSVGSTPHWMDAKLRQELDQQLHELMDRAKGIVRDNEHVIWQLVQALLDRRTLSGSDVATLLDAAGDNAPALLSPGGP